MSNYLFQGQADSQGQLGPTNQKLVDQDSFKSSKARALESLFDVAAPLGAYSGEAQGAINPLSLLQKAYLDKALKSGAGEQALFEDHGLVKSGKHSWGKFEEDAINPAWRKKFSGMDKYGLVQPLKPEELSLSDIFKSSLSPERNARVQFDPNMSSNEFGGLILGNQQRPIIQLNSNRARRPDEFDGTVQHEYQHLLDTLGGRSAGTNTKTVQQRLNKFQNRPRDYVDFDEYIHNIGEVRARQNDFLNNSPDFYKGIQSVFHNQGRDFYPERLWGE